MGFPLVLRGFLLICCQLQTEGRNLNRNPAGEGRGAHNSWNTSNTQVRAEVRPEATLEARQWQQLPSSYSSKTKAKTQRNEIKTTESIPEV